MAQLRGRSLHASEPQVKSHLKQEAETVTTKPENRLVYANTRGFGIMETLEHLTSQLEELKKESRSEIKELKNENRESRSEIKVLKDENRGSRSKIMELEEKAKKSKEKALTQDRNLLALEGRVTDLALVSEGYFEIRMRFLDNYKKKINNHPDFQTTESIEAGNARAHRGDAAVDAILFREEKRPQDPKTFEELYGMDHSDALAYADERVYRVLNARASQITQKRPFSAELELAFMNYLGTLNQKDGQGRAVGHFWKLYNNEYPASK